MNCFEASTDYPHRDPRTAPYWNQLHRGHCFQRKQLRSEMLARKLCAFVCWILYTLDEERNLEVGWHHFISA